MKQQRNSMFNSKVLDYPDVYLQPNYSEIKSRDSIDQSLSFLGDIFVNPVMPANMATTINFDLAEEMAEEGYFYALHRFYEYDEIFCWIKKIYESIPVVSISLGVKSKDVEFVDRLYDAGLHIDFITIDVSHGHHLLVKKMIKHIKTKLITKVIAGNVTTKAACLHLKSWGADAAKVGIARGSACTTYNTTGVGTAGHFSTLLECSKAGLPIIADGGIKEIGDISKALVAGASMVMCGSLFAACKDSPAENFYEEGGTKIYYGSASAKNKGTDKYIEGRDCVYLQPNNLTYLELMEKINQGLRSTMSFGGYKDIKDLRKMKYLYR